MISKVKPFKGMVSKINPHWRFQKWNLSKEWLQKSPCRYLSQIPSRVVLGHTFSGRCFRTHRHSIHCPSFFSRPSPGCIEKYFDAVITSSPFWFIYLFVYFLFFYIFYRYVNYKFHQGRKLGRRNDTFIPELMPNENLYTSKIFEEIMSRQTSTASNISIQPENRPASTLSMTSTTFSQKKESV